MNGVHQLEQEGFFLVRSVFTDEEVAEFLVELTQALAKPDVAILNSEGVIYAARNLFRVWPRATEVWRRPPLAKLTGSILGQQCGLVRGLYFDKPPTQTWTLPWHKDLTIAVRNNCLLSGQFTKPTTKAGVPHVEASQAVLESMLTARIHLDDVTDDNGPISVIPGSHHSGKSLDIDESRAYKLLASRGDVLLIRPLVAHNSNPCRAGNKNHRRVVHLEFAAERQLPDGYEWHDFIEAS